MVYGILRDLRTVTDDIFKQDHSAVYRWRSGNDPRRDAVAAHKRDFISVVWILYGVFLPVPRTGEGPARVCPGSLPAGNLFRPGYSGTSCILGNKRDTLCTADRGCTFCHYYHIYGTAFTQRIKFCQTKTFH